MAEHDNGEPYVPVSGCFTVLALSISVSGFALYGIYRLII